MDPEGISFVANRPRPWCGEDLMVVLERKDPRSKWTVWFGTRRENMVGKSYSPVDSSRRRERHRVSSFCTEDREEALGLGREERRESAVERWGSLVL